MSTPKIDESRYHPVDVLVVGGGMAGVAAAVAAARSGAATMLVEKAGWLGGMGITGATGLHSFFNIFDAHPNTERMRVLAGIAQELVDRVTEAGGGMGHVRMERGGDFVSMLTLAEPEVFKLVAAKMVLESGVHLLLHTACDEVRATSGHVEGVVVANKAGRNLVRAAQYIDCTGDGDLAAWAGAPFEHYRADDRGAYPAGFTFRLCNIDLAALEADLDHRGVLTQVAHAVKPNTTSPDLIRLGLDVRKLRDTGVDLPVKYFLSTSLRPRELTFVNCMNHGPNDGLDPAMLTNAEIDLRERMFEIARIFRENFDGCAECYPAGPAPSVGQRRGRAIECLYGLTEADCTGGRQFTDQIGCFSFIDNHNYMVRDGGAYGIPYRALIPRDLDNVLISGRMMTLDKVAHNSTRMVGCILACGQAAGTAAAMSAAQGCAPCEIDSDLLRDRLAADGVLLAPVPDPL